MMEDIKEKVNSLKAHYRSGRDEIGADFFQPCLAYCKSYKRAVGYFSSSVLITWASALPKFIKEKDLSIKLLVSPILTSRDKEALEKIIDLEKREEFLQSISDEIVLDALSFANGDHSIEKRMRLFAWMVATNKLELRFAYPIHVENPGIFHEKIGIFTFFNGEKVAFTGSANESEMGHVRNYESIDVFRSWNPSDSERVEIKETQFEEAWKGDAIGLKIKKLSKEVLQKVKSYSDDWDEDSKEEETSDPKPGGKWQHQELAIAKFLKHERGVLNMATGTGKTRTALRICGELIDRKKIDTIIIATSGNDLMDQWHSNILKVARTYLRSKFSILRHYRNHKEKDFFIINPQWNLLIISREELSQVLPVVNTTSAGKRTLLIHDEVHGLGSPTNREKLSGLSQNIRFRLGLSATPERVYDEDGNKFILEHIGPTIFKFGLEKAIERGILCPFNYISIEYEVTEEDKDQIKKIRARYELLKNTSTPMMSKDFAMLISNVYKNSEAKIPLFEEFISRNPDVLNRNIIFVSTKEYGEKILDIVHKFNPNFHTYFSGERSETLERFAKGDLECMITCHRLSEGIDIQSLNNVVIFASDRSKLELIQRIGRCLRTDPYNPDKIANIIDFVRINTSLEQKTADEERKEWLTGLSKIRPKE